MQILVDTDSAVRVFIAHGLAFERILNIRVTKMVIIKTPPATQTRIIHHVLHEDESIENATYKDPGEGTIVMS